MFLLATDTPTDMTERLMAVPDQTNVMDVWQDMQHITSEIVDVIVLSRYIIRKDYYYLNRDYHYHHQHLYSWLMDIFHDTALKEGNIKVFLQERIKGDMLIQLESFSHAVLPRVNGPHDRNFLSLKSYLISVWEDSFWY